jgi:Bacterial membrane protein YfhO
MKGWTATVNGKTVKITTVNGVYQRITLPAGTSTVEYKFFPPHERYALLLGFLAGLFLIGSFLDERWRFFPSRRRPRTKYLPSRDRSGSSTLAEKGAGPTESPVDPTAT